MPKLGPFPRGMNNKTEDHDLPQGSVRNLVNVDVSNSGKLSRRKGYATKIYDGLGCKAGFNSPIGTFFIEGADLMKLNSDNSATPLERGIVFGEFRTFEYNNDIVYFSDGLITRKIHADDTVTKWGISPPGEFIIYPTAGTFDAGRYMAAVTFVDAYGVESGASPIAYATLGAGKGVVFDNLPTTSDPQVVGLRIYLSMPDGGTMFYIGEVPLGTSSYSVITGSYDDERYLETELVGPPPSGHNIRFFAGRLWVLNAYGIWYTEPFQLDHCRLGDNYIHLPHEPQIMEPVTDGFYVADLYTTDFYAGRDPNALNRIDGILNYGAIKGTGARSKNSNKVTWMSQRGMVEAGPGGAIVNKQEANVATETATHGASIIREQDGVRQFISSIHNVTTSSLAARSFIDAEVIRKGA